jgi:DNA invertase Pin-like site-specific DNA recombinase
MDYAYAYARVSTLAQDLDIQLETLERAGIPPSQIFQEKRSGVADRPVRAELLAQLQAGDTLTVHRLDRLGRSVSDLLAVVQDLDQRGVKFRCVAQPIDTGTASGRMLLTMLAAVSEMERSLLLERTSEGLARREALGLPHGRPRMYGTVGAGPTAVDPTQAEAEAEVIRYAADYVLSGAPMNQIVDVLNWRGIQSRDGGRWAVNALRRVLTNPQAEEIIGTDTYRSLTQIFDNRSGRRQKLGRPADHLLSGILTCGPCSQPLYWTWKTTRAGGREEYYRCKKGSGGRFRGCGRVGVAAGRADAYAEEMFIAAVAGPEFAAALNRRQAELLGDVDVDLDGMREEIQDLENVPARFAPPNAAERLAQLRREVREATARLLAAPALTQMVELPKSEAALRELWQRWTVAERRVWIKRLVSTIVVQPATVRGRGSDVESRMDPRWRI